MLIELDELNTFIYVIHLDQRDNIELMVTEVLILSLKSFFFSPVDFLYDSLYSIKSIRKFSCKFLRNFVKDSYYNALSNHGTFPEEIILSFISGKFDIKHELESMYTHAFIQLDIINVWHATIFTLFMIAYMSGLIVMREISLKF